MAVKDFSGAYAYPGYKAPQVDLVAGRAVVADSNGVVNYVSNPAVVTGILAQDVIATNVNTHILPSVKHFARYGEYVGVYVKPGDIIETDQVIDTVAIGDKLYAVASGANQGKLTKTDPGGGTVVAKVLAGGTAGDFVRIMLV